ncbi:10063_t:CDS:1 [Funneliformis geosporum]|uniref:10599_t:CDS:1 n=1 Tax=Funneliformis geosporum TaxID=1117311 RepID=A0A9W4WPU8_9GLOM|nr:10599_t:CDS:1 [Funneliformis geosporum]CAI2178594.1 10063_t:CDS:1 [Funneliformis geosporum]
MSSDSDSCPPSPTSQSCITVCVGASDSEDECQQGLISQHRKSVQFSRFLVVHETWCNDEYDRTSMEPARLNFKEYEELLQLRCDLRREMDKMVKAAATQASSNN